MIAFYRTAVDFLDSALTELQDFARLQELEPGNKDAADGAAKAQTLIKQQKEKVCCALPRVYRSRPRAGPQALRQDVCQVIWLVVVATMQAQCNGSYAFTRRDPSAGGTYPSAEGCGERSRHLHAPNP